MASHKMASHKKEPPRTPAAGPEKHDDDPEQSLARYATTVGVVTGLFGMLFGVGLILLPSATIREKVLVIAASLAVSVAGLTGVGAWRSRRRFGLTALAGGLAIVSLAGLSVVAASGVRSTAHAATGSSSAAQSGDIRKTGSSKKTAHASLSPTSSPVRTHGPSSGGSSHATDSASTGPSPAVDPIYLSKLTGDPGSDQRWVGPLGGSWAIGGIKYTQSLGYSVLCNHNTPVIYDVDKTDRTFLAEVGVADGGSADDKETQVMFIVGAGTGGGSFTTLTSATAKAEYPSSLDVPLPSGTTELELTTNIMDGACMGGSTIVWGNARVTP